MIRLTPENFEQNVLGRIGKVEPNGRTFYLAIPDHKTFQYQVPISSLDMLRDLRQVAGSEKLSDWTGLEVEIYLSAGKLRLQAAPDSGASG